MPASILSCGPRPTRCFALFLPHPISSFKLKPSYFFHVLQDVGDALSLEIKKRAFQFKSEMADFPGVYLFFLRERFFHAGFVIGQDAIRPLIVRPLIYLDDSHAHMSSLCIVHAICLLLLVFVVMIILVDSLYLQVSEIVRERRLRFKLQPRVFVRTAAPQDLICGICGEDVEKQDLILEVAFPCKHSFHAECGKQALKSVWWKCPECGIS